MTNAQRVIVVCTLCSVPGAGLADEVKLATAHFEMVHDVAPQEAAVVAGVLESTYEAVVGFLTELKLPQRLSSRRLVVRLFGQLVDFQREVTKVGHLPEGIVGLYVAESNVTLLLRPESIPAIAALDHKLEQASGPKVTILRAQRDDLVERVRRLTIAHEAAHQVLFNLVSLDHAARQPAWLLEGMACLFEPKSSDTDFRRADFPKGITVPKLREVIAAATLNGPDAAENYAIAYVLVDHLRRTRPLSLAALMTPSRDPTLADFERVGGPIDASLIEALQRTARRGESGK